PDARQLPILEITGRQRRAPELRVSGRELLADRVALVVVVEEAPDPAPRPVPGRDEPDLLVDPLVGRRLARVGGERRKLLVAPLLVEEEVRLIPLADLLVARQAGRGRELGETEVRDDLDAEEPVLLIVRLEEPVRGFVAARAERVPMIHAAAAG